MGINAKVSTPHAQPVKLSATLATTNAKVAVPYMRQVRFSTNNTPIVIHSDAHLTETSLSQLHDVNMQNYGDGDILIYSASTQTFNLETANNLSIAILDGGSF